MTNINYESIWTAKIKYHRLGVYKQYKFIVHSSGGWEVQDQGTRMFIS